MGIGNNVRRWRERRSFSQAELASLVGVSTNTIYRIEVKGRVPRPSTLRKIAEVLKVDPSDLRELESGGGKGGNGN